MLRNRTRKSISPHPQNLTEKSQIDDESYGTQINSSNKIDEMIQHRDTHGTTQQPASKTATDETRDWIIPTIDNNHNEADLLNDVHNNLEEELEEVYRDKMDYDDDYIKKSDTSQHREENQEQQAEQTQNQSTDKNRDIIHQEMHHQDQQQHLPANKDTLPPTQGRFRTQQPPFIVTNTKINVLAGILLKILSIQNFIF